MLLPLLLQTDRPTDVEFSRLIASSSSNKEQAWTREGCMTKSLVRTPGTMSLMSPDHCQLSLITDDTIGTSPARVPQTLRRFSKAVHNEMLVLYD
jgi:hypothetical protein